MNQPNSLYLGRLVDEQNQLTDQPIEYPLDHLTTHALLLGATGSGKTGLGLALVEEALRQQIPALLLDVKGDLANLLLTFPDLSAEDFAPWIDADAMRRQGQTPEQAAQSTAERWRTGLAGWGLGPEHIAHLRHSADIALYTPGLRAGRPVDILARFSAPPTGDPDAAVLRAQGLTSALLGLAGVDADPLRSREHILLTTLIRHAWDTQGTVDIPTLIRQVQQPPLEHIGVFDVESFFPQKARFDLALTLNNLIAAPGFARWREGEALDIDRFLYTPERRPRASVFYLAHLPEEQRQFFVTLFLEELRTWTRAQAGTRAVRALLYFDEIFGYLPPHPYNPPTKEPLLALVKQGRAAGLGVILSTQNPADLDYKGLGNIGTWFVGALRTDRDKARVLEGMGGAIAEAGMTVGTVETALSRLKPRLFLMHDAQEGKLRFFFSRWTMSYLRGPLTVAEAQQLATPQPTTDLADADFSASTPVSPTPQPPDYQTTRLSDYTTTRQDLRQRSSRPPTVDPEIPQAFLPATITATWAMRNHSEALPSDAPVQLIYRPYLLGAGVTHIFNQKAGITVRDEQIWRIDPAAGGSWNLRWDQGEMIDMRLDDLSPTHSGEGVFEALPKGLGSKTAHAKRESALRTHLYRRSQVTIWTCSPLKLFSPPEESKRAFLDRCRQEAERQKEAALTAERQKFEQRMERVEAKIRREEMELYQDKEMLSERKREELLSGAESVLSLLSKRRHTLRPLSTTSRQRRYVKQAQAEVEESEEALRLYEEEMQQLEAAWQATARQIIEKWENTLDDIREIVVRAKRADIDVRFCGLAWFPFWEVLAGNETVLLPAYFPNPQ
ncbi:MAG: helicase HerA domain-containing protein [Anaerolineae bacterium]